MQNPAFQTQMEKVIEILLAAGFQPQGQTAGQHYKVITKESYPLAGALVDIKGRPRFTHPSGIRCTVGRRTTFFYRPTGGLYFADQFRFNTVDTAGIQQHVSEVK